MTSMRCNLVFRPAGIRHAAALVPHDLKLTGERFLPERFQLLADIFLVGDEDLGLIERNAERLGIGDFRTDQAHLVGQGFGRTAERDDVALLQHKRGIGAELLACPGDIDDPVFGMGSGETPRCSCRPSPHSRAGRLAARTDGSR